MTITLRCRGPNGQATLSGVDPGMSTHDFLDLLSAKTGVPAAFIEILTGFPPKTIQVPADGTVSMLALANGDTLTVRPGPAASPPVVATAPSQLNTSNAAAASASGAASQGFTQAADTAPSSAGTAAAATAAAAFEDEDEMLARAIAASLEEQGPSGGGPQAAAAAGGPTGRSPAPDPHSAARQQQHRPRPEEGGVAGRSVSNGPAAGGPAPLSAAVPGGGGSCVVRRVIDSDNSCLFNAVGYVMERSRSRADALRKVVAQVVAGDPITFNDGFLGKDVQEYCNWIQQRDKWGGAIELFILSQHYGREIAAFDIQTKRCDIYGQDKGYPERALLIYDGLHYDALAVAAFEGGPEELDVTMFRPGGAEGAAIMEAAEKLVAATHAARQFTDTANFTLRCGVCQMGFK
ncbi:hypothetical protein PLESTF_000892900, partial [Pleodorina starrii]